MIDAFISEGTKLRKGQTNKMKKENDEIKKCEASLVRSHS